MTTPGNTGTGCEASNGATRACTGLPACTLGRVTEEFGMGGGGFLRVRSGAAQRALADGEAGTEGAREATSLGGSLVLSPWVYYIIDPAARRATAAATPGKRNRPDAANKSTRGVALWSAFEAAFEHGREAQWPGRGENAVAKVDFGAQFWPPLRPIGIPACVFSTFFWNGFWTGKNAHAGGAVQNM